MESTALNWVNPIHKPCFQFLLGLIISTIYIPGIVGASIPTGWLFLIIAMPIIFCFCKAEIGFSLLFFVYVALSFVWTQNLNIALFFFFQMIALGCVYCLGSSIKDLKAIFKGLAFGLGISSILALVQYKGYTGVFATNNLPAGLFLNTNIYSEASAIVLIGLMVLRLFWWTPVTFIGLVLVPSRTALLTLITCYILFLYKKNKLWCLFGVASILLFASILFWNDFKITSIQERLNLWVDTIRGFSFKGNGVGSFEILYPLNAINVDTSIARPRYAHNDLLQLIFEFGIGVLLLIPIFWKVFISDNEYKIIVYGVGIVSLFTFPFHVPMLAFIGCLVAGFVIINNDTVRNTWNNR